MLACRILVSHVNVFYYVLRRMLKDLFIHASVASLLCELAGPVLHGDDGGSGGGPAGDVLWVSVFRARGFSSSSLQHG